MYRPRVTVAIIAYNSEKFIEQAINSVINQTYENWVIVVGDDGSNDATLDILKKYKKMLGDKIKIISHKENKGANYNWNSLVPYYEGEYVAKLDADDYWHKDKLQEQIVYMENNKNVAISYHPVYKVFECSRKIKMPKEQKYEGPASQIFIERGCVAYSCTVMWKNKYSVTIPKELEKVGDWYLWIMIGANGDLGYLDKRLAYYRVHGDNVTIKDNKVQYIMENIEILKIIQTKLNCDKTIIENAINNQAFNLVYKYIQFKNYDKAKEAVSRISSYRMNFKEKTVCYFLDINWTFLFEIFIFFRRKRKLW